MMMRKESSFSESIEASVFQINICEEIEEFYTLDNETEEVDESVVADPSTEVKEIWKPSVPIVLEFARNVSFDKHGKVVVPTNNLQTKWRTDPYLPEYSTVSKKSIWGNWEVLKKGKVEFAEDETGETLTKAYKHLVQSFDP